MIIKEISNDIFFVVVPLSFRRSFNRPTLTRGWLAHNVFNKVGFWICSFESTKTMQMR